MLPSITLAFAGGLLLGSYVPYIPVTIICVVSCLALILTILEKRERLDTAHAMVLFGSLLVGILYWFVAVEGITKSAVVLDEERPVPRSLTGRIVAPVRQGMDRLVLIVKLDKSSELSPQPKFIQLTWRHPDRMLLQGDRIGVKAALHGPSGLSNPGGFDYASYLERKGIDAVTTVNGARAIELLESGRNDLWWMVWNQFDRWRGSIRASAIQNLSQPALGLFLGIIVGEQGFLDQDLRDRFMVTGTVHLLSISGSHIGLIGVMVFISVRQLILLLPNEWLLGVSRRITACRLAAGLTVFPVAAYTVLAGAEVATVRSFVMVLVALLAKWLGHEQRIFHTLSVAAMAILIHDPQVMFDISFQLSFMSVAAIAWWLALSRVSGKHEESDSPILYAPVVQWATNLVAMSAVVTVATFPLVAFYFNQLPWLGLLTNIVAIPIMGTILVPLGLVSAVGQIVTGANSLAFAGTLQWVMDCFVQGLTAMASTPGGEWHVAAPSLAAMVVFYGCVVTAWSDALKRHMRWWPVVGSVIILAWWVWSPRSFTDGDRFRVTFLDVAQGDSAVVELPDGQVVLIDGGSAFERFDMGRSVVAPFLWSRGIRTIDHVIATHPQLDHVGGLAWILQHFSVRHFWGNGDQRDEPFHERLRQALALRGLTEHVVREGREVLSSDACRLLVLNPTGDGHSVESAISRRRGGHILNNRSVVTELSCGKHHFLFTGDVEEETLRRLRLHVRDEPIEVVKVPHHGAGSSLDVEWLRAVRPQVAVISVGRHNPYGHPATAVLEAYAGQGVRTYRTDNDGAIWVIGSVSSASLRIHRMEDERIEPIVWRSCFWTCERENLSRLISRYRPVGVIGG